MESCPESSTRSNLISKGEICQNWGVLFIDKLRKRVRSSLTAAQIERIHTEKSKGMPVRLINTVKEARERKTASFTKCKYCPDKENKKAHRGLVKCELIMNLRSIL